MPTWLLYLLNGLLYVFHTGLIFINCFGWIPAKTRRWTLACQAATLGSWTILGIWHGFGYCLCTDWQSQIRAQLGIHDPTRTYIQLLVYKASGWIPPIDLTTTLTGIVFVISVVGCLTFNGIDLRKALAAKRNNANLGRA